MKIVKVIGREIFDSRGFPTVECEIHLQDGAFVRASVPAGVSRGAHEAVELRDGGKRLMGMGVRKAVENLENIIGPALIGNVPDVVKMDIQLLQLDGTDDKSSLGANAMLAASIAVCKAQALVESMPLYELMTYLCDFEMISLPCPLFNMINGGAHADNNLQIQEIMVVPVGMDNFRAAMEFGVTVFHELKKLLKTNGKSIAVGDEGGFAPNFNDEKEALDYVLQAIEAVDCGDQAGALIALDVAASQFYNAEKQEYTWRGKKMSADELIAWYEQLISQYPICSIEDGLGEEDWQGWQRMTTSLGDKVQLVGDDIFVTDVQRIWYAIEHNVANAALIKPNQIGTLTQTFQAIKLCKEHDMGVIVSHRSGETNDSFIADLAVGVSAAQIKAGSCSRGERMAKYNRLLRIEQELLARAQQR